MRSGITTYLTVDKALWLDAAATGAMGVLLLAGAGPLAPLLGISAEVLRAAGGLLIPFTALLAWTARQSPPPPAVLRLIVGGNVAWAVASVLVVALGWLAPTPLGTAFVLAQAVVVGLFAHLEYQGAREKGTTFRPTPGGHAP